MYRTVIFGIAAALIIAGKASAQSDFPTTGGAIGGETGGYERLSPGNRKIADALFEAQKTGKGTASWSMEDIARTKQSGPGWGNVFRQMKADGLVAETNLGQIVSGRGKTETGFRAIRGQASAVHRIRPVRSNVIVTTANGQRAIFGLSASRQSVRRSAGTRNVEKTAVKNHGVKTLGRGGQANSPTVSMTARRAFIATHQSSALGRAARGAGKRARGGK